MKNSQENHDLWPAFQAVNKEALGLIYSQNVRELFRYGVQSVSISDEFVIDRVHDLLHSFTPIIYPHNYAL